MKTGFTILLVMILFMGGCKNGRQAQSSVQTGRTSLDFKVITDISQIRDAEQEARKRKPEKISTFIMQNINGYLYVDDDMIQKMEKERASIVRQLSMVLNEKGQKENIRLNAIEILLKLEEESVITVVNTILESGAINTQRALLSRLSNAPRRFIIKYPLLIKNILTHLSSTDEGVHKAAVQASGFLNLPGAVDIFARMLKQPEAVDKGRLCYWIGKREPTMENLELIKGLVEDKKSNKDLHWISSAFEAFIQSDPKRFTSPVLKIVAGHITTENQDGGIFGVREQFARLLANHGGPEYEAELIQILEGKYTPMTKGLALTRLSKIMPQKALPVIRKYINERVLTAYCVDALGVLKKDTGDEETIKLLKDLSKDAGPRLLSYLAYALIEIAGKQSHDTVRGFLKRMTPNARTRMLWLLEGITIQSFLVFLQEENLVDEVDIDASISKLKEEWGDDIPESDIHLAYGMLAKAGIYFGFDAETGTVPCRHDLLIDEFARHSRGMFKPEWTDEIFNQKHADDFEADYTVRFLMEGKLYQFKAGNYGDWYDVENVLKAVNLALADAGLEERYYPLPVDGQVAEFIFAKPGFIKKLSGKFHIHVGVDADKARKEGIAAEEKVFEMLREN